MILDIRKDQNSGLFHIVACLVIWFGAVVYLPQTHASDNLENEVQEFLSSYFMSARRYDVVNMIEHLSRSALARNLRPIVRSRSDDAIKRSVLLLFQSDFIFAGYCRIHILEVEPRDVEVKVRIWFERTIDRPGTGPVYDFFLTRESGGLRVVRKVFFREDKLSNSTVDIDLCDVPINWDNPTMLKPGETPEEQSRRLGISLLP